MSNTNDTSDASDGPLAELREKLTYPTFHPSTIPVQVDPNTVHIRSGPWGGPVFTVRDTDEDDAITDVLERIDGRTHVDDITEGMSESECEEIARALAALYDSNVVYDAEEAEDDELYPHLLMKQRFQERERRRLDDQSVLLVNAGRIGPQVGEDLLSYGVGEVGFVQPVDAHAVEAPQLANDERATTYDAESLESAVKHHDFLVYTANRMFPELETEVNELTQATNTPWVTGQILGFDGLVGPAIFPGETACFECFRSRTYSNVKNPRGYDEYCETLADDDHLATASLPGFSRMIAGLLSLDLLHLLSYGVGYTSGRVVTVDANTLEMEENEVLKLPRCEACGREPGVDVGRFLTLDDMVEADEFNQAARHEEADD